MVEVALQKPEVRGVVVITRNGVIVGKMPLTPPPPAAKQDAAAHNAEGDEEKSEQSEHSDAGEDPF
jgi:hypothetical protein